jgi:hypothetical protein
MDARMGIAGFRLTPAPYEHALEDDVRGITLGESAANGSKTLGNACVWRPQGMN